MESQQLNSASLIFMSISGLLWVWFYLTADVITLILALLIYFAGLGAFLAYVIVCADRYLRELSPVEKSVTPDL